MSTWIYNGSQVSNCCPLGYLSNLCSPPSFSFFLSFFLFSSFFVCFSLRFFSFLLLAHLSRRLIGGLLGYSWSVVRLSSSSFTMLLDLLLRNRWANQSQILCGASLGRGDESLFVGPGSHDQDGRHAHIW